MSKSIELIKKSQGAWISPKLLVEYFSKIYENGASDIVEENNENYTLLQYSNENKQSLLWCDFNDQFGYCLVFDGWLDKNMEVSTDLGSKYLIAPEIVPSDKFKVSTDDVGDIYIKLL